MVASELRVRAAARGLTIVAMTVAVATGGWLSFGPRPAFAVETTTTAAVRGGSVIVGVTDPARMGEIRAALVDAGGLIKKQYSWNAFLVSAPAGMSSHGFAAVARVIPGVRYASGNATIHAIEGVAPVAPRSGTMAAASVTNDPYYAQQWGLPAIGADIAWNTADGAGIKIGIIDSGIDESNPDLAGKVVAQHDYANGDAVAADDYGHGTHVAGIAAAARNNGEYGCGVAPGAQLVIAKVLDLNGEGDVADAVSGIHFAVDHHAKIINMSFGTTTAYDDVAPLVAAVADARAQGCLVVASAGNTDIFSPTDVVYPAACAGVIGVGATDKGDQHAGFSVQGTRPGGGSVVVLSAPGVEIWSLYTNDDRWGQMEGTSMSAPFVSGAVAVIWSRYPWLTADEVTRMLESTAVDLGAPGRDTLFGYGRIQLDTALNAPFEPDGTPAQALLGPPAQSHQISSGEACVHTVSPTGDVDYQWADLVAGHSYRFWTEDLHESADTVLALYSQDSTTPLATNDDAAVGDPSSLIAFTPSVSGRYLIANSDPHARGGVYTLRMEDGSVVASVSLKVNASVRRRGQALTLTGQATPVSQGGAIYKVYVKRPGTTVWQAWSPLRTMSVSNTWTWTTMIDRSRFPSRGNSYWKATLRTTGVYASSQSKIVKVVIK